MDIFLSTLKLAAGIGLFLFAMYLIEESLKNISGRNFKLFLQRVSKNTIGGAAGGALVTAVFQSSSMVSLMVLAFVGAGVFAMKNAMAIILGANLGTTLDSWIVATLGFKVNIEIIAYPVVCLGGFLLAFLRDRKVVKYTSYFLLGFGLLFIGLSFMKTAMEEEVRTFDFSKYAGMPQAVFLLAGFMLTLLVQSSSVTMALTLTSIHTGAIDFPNAAAIVLGSETGTTIKLFLSSLGGNVTKKRLALGNFIFNITMTVMFFIFLNLILRLIVQGLGIADPLIGLVTFSSLINLFSIIIFLPLLGPFTKFLQRFFKNTDTSTAAFISNANIYETETPMDVFWKETEYFIHNCMLFNLEQFTIDTNLYPADSSFKLINEHKRFFKKSAEEKYLFLKQLQGELQVFYLALRSELQDSETSQLNQLISAVRSAMYAVKSLKDINRNTNELMRSSKAIKYDFFMQHKKGTEQLYSKLNKLLTAKQKPETKELLDMIDGIQTSFSSSLNDFYQNVKQQPIDGLDMTTVINFNRELFTSNKAMLIAIKDFLFDEKEAQEFNELPVYTT
jgi:phosphate:Na+ symporter